MQSPSLFQTGPARSIFSIVAAVVLVGGFLSVRMYLGTQHAEALRIEAEFGRRAEVRNALTREIISNYQSGVYALKSLFEGSDNVSREEFHRVASDVLTRYPGITALEWVPLVTEGDRAKVEAKAAQELALPFQFTERGPADRMVRTGSRTEHFPILYVEPLAGNERALGFDVQSAPPSRYLHLARETGQAVATGKFQLVQGRPGVVLFWPVTSTDHTSPSQKRLRGFVHGVFAVEEMLGTSALRSPETATETVYLDDGAELPIDRILHFQGSQADNPSATQLEAEFQRDLHREYELEFGGRKWRGLYRPTRGWLAEQRTHLAGLQLLVGLLITALVASLVAFMARRTSAIQKEVTERTAELSESRRHLGSLLHALPGMAYRCIYKDKLRVVYLSEGVEALTGYRADEFTSDHIHFRDLIHPDDLEQVRSSSRTSLKTRRDVEVEYRIRPRTGSEKWVLSRGRGVYGEQGDLLFFEGLAIDITARKQAEADKLSIERKLLESQKLESLGLLAGGIAHDFNNLLTGIMGHANLARFSAGIDPETSEHLGKIEKGAVRAAELCQQMLAYSGRGNFLIEPVDVDQLVRDTLPLLQSSFSSRTRVSLLLSSQPTWVMADATQLRQIAMNLILNAADALGATGGEITVSTGRRQIGREFLAKAHGADTLIAGEYVFLEVRDNGCGMSADTIGKIFDPFFTTKFTGRGLGLAAVLGIVRGHSGALRVQSELNQGSAFTLILPPTKPMLARDSDTPTPARWQREGRVLVIDDEESVRNVAAALLHTFGLVVAKASSGLEGIEQFRENPDSFDLVLLDLTMPGMDGEETLSRLRAISTGVRVLLTSGYSECDRIAALAESGSLLFLQKPFTRDSLEQRLREIFALVASET